MKKFLKSIGNFFKKIGLFIWKCLKICWDYIKGNAWIQPIAIVALIFALFFGFQGIVSGIEKIKENNATKAESTNNKYTKLTMAEVRAKLNNDEDFVLFIGSHDCAHCIQYTTVINRYITSTGNTIYYIDIGDTSDTTLTNNYLVEFVERLQEIETRDFTDSLSTPTTVIVRGGEFVDAKSGALGLEGGEDYYNLTKFLEGEYIGKIEA